MSLSPNQDQLAAGLGYKGATSSETGSLSSRETSLAPPEHEGRREGPTDDISAAKDRDSRPEGPRRSSRHRRASEPVSTPAHPTPAGPGRCQPKAGAVAASSVSIKYATDTAEKNQVKKQRQLYALV